MGTSTVLPRRVTIANSLETRYQPGTRPVSWDERIPGIEKVVTTEGEELLLSSSGGQSSPATGWEILLTKKVNSNSNTGEALEWTLYGLPRLRSS